MCDKPITENETLESIKNLAIGKTPGSDGLLADFYQFFWIDIKSLLCNSIYYALINGELSIEQKERNNYFVTKKREKSTIS